MARRGLASIVVVLHCSLLWAGEYKGNGYSLSLPVGWTVADKDSKQAVEDTAKSKFKVEPGMDAVFFALDRSTNANVVITSGSLPVAQKEISGAIEAIRSGYASLGITTQWVDSQVVQVNGRSYYLFKMDNSHSSFPARMRQWHLIGSAGGKIYTFTFSTNSSDAAAWEPTFNQLVQSVTLHPGIVGWLLELPWLVQSVLVGGVIGGVIGGFIGVIKVLTKKRIPPEQLDVGPPPLPPPTI
jgi:hypothetical protein